MLFGTCFDSHVERHGAGCPPHRVLTEADYAWAARQVVSLAERRCGGRVVCVMAAGEIEAEWVSEKTGGYLETCTAACVAALMGKDYHGGI